MARIDLCLWILTAGGAVVAAARVMSLGLFRFQPFRSFFYLLVIGLLREAFLARFQYDTASYATWWSVTLAPLLIAHAAAAIEAFRSITAQYPNIGRFATIIFVGALCVATGFGILSLLFQLPRIRGEEVFLRSVYLLYHWVDGLSAGALIFGVLYLKRYPIPLSRMAANLKLHLVLLTSYFSASSLLFFVENLTPLRSSIWLERLTFGLVALLYGGWAIGLAKDGNRTEPFPVHDRTAAAAAGSL